MQNLRATDYILLEFLTILACFTLFLSYDNISLNSKHCTNMEGHELLICMLPVEDNFSVCILYIHSENICSTLKIYSEFRSYLHCVGKYVCDDPSHNISNMNDRPSTTKNTKSQFHIIFLKNKIGLIIRT